MADPERIDEHPSVNRLRDVRERISSIFRITFNIEEADHFHTRRYSNPKKILRDGSSYRRSRHASLLAANSETLSLNLDGKALVPRGERA